MGSRVWLRVPLRVWSRERQWWWLPVDVVAVVAVVVGGSGGAIVPLEVFGLCFVSLHVFIQDLDLRVL